MIQAEIEAKFLNVDFDKLRARLTELGAVCEQPMRQMSRKNYDFPDLRLDKIDAWVRVRDEGDKITAAFKQLQHRGVDGMKEVQIVVNDFERMGLFLEQLGLEANQFQETKRESWRLGEVEIEFDEWPWIPPFVEFEAPNEELLFEVAAKCGFEKKDALHGSVEIVYRQEYDITEADIDHCERITFGPVPDWLEAKRWPEGTSPEQKQYIKTGKPELDGVSAEPQ